MHLTSSLGWATHIDTICSEACRTLGYLRRNLNLASPKIKKKLAYLTFVRPKLEYASAIWHPSQTYLTLRIEAIQNRASRFISTKYSNHFSVTALKLSLSLPTFHSRRVIARLCLIHKFFHWPQSRHSSLTPPYRISSRLNHSRPIAPITCSTSAFSLSFFPNAVSLWNALPDDIVTCTDNKRFRDKLGENIITQD